MDNGWPDLMKFFKSSEPTLKHMSRFFDLDVGSKAERINNILTFVQMKSDRMSYKRDANPSDSQEEAENSCREYMRKPAISLADGLQLHGSE